jgi:hypothetical protein
MAVVISDCFRFNRVNRERLETKSFQEVPFASLILITLGAVPWLMQLVAGLSPQNPGFAPGSIHLRFAATKWHWDRFFFDFFGFPCQYNSTVVLHIHISSGG